MKSVRFDEDPETDDLLDRHRASAKLLICTDTESGDIFTAVDFNDLFWESHLFDMVSPKNRRSGQGYWNRPRWNEMDYTDPYGSFQDGLFELEVYHIFFDEQDVKTVRFATSFSAKEEMSSKEVIALYLKRQGFSYEALKSVMEN